MEQIQNSYVLFENKSGGYLIDVKSFQFSYYSDSFKLSYSEALRIKQQLESLGYIIQMIPVENKHAVYRYNLNTGNETK